MRLELTSVIPADSHNYDLSLGAMRLHEAVCKLDQYGLGHVMTGMRHSVSHPDPDIRQMVQGNVDEIMHAYAVLYYFSVWDHCFDATQSDDILTNWATPDEAQMFRALKHIRHSTAHSFSGKRANQSRGPFEAVMNSTQAFHGLVWDQAADTIDLTNSQISTDCRAFFHEFAKGLSGRLLNDKRPTA
ncbi:MAG: hypothetical protein KA312_01595 [Sphingorhabdus sp.]|nr:hypothetical protein [Sphingorhabdus sp.]